jgi:hypothetical protein
MGAVLDLKRECCVVLMEDHCVRWKTSHYENLGVESELDPWKGRRFCHRKYFVVGLTLENGRETLQAA